MNTEHERVLDEVVTAYLKSVEAGDPPNREELLARHPDLAADLSAYFAAESHVNRVAAPLRAPAFDEPTTGLGEPAPTGAGTRVSYFGDYRLLEELGRGGMGVVYKARQESLNRIVAIKMILTGQLANDDDVRPIRAEAEAAAKLDHPGIVPVFEVGQHEGHHYFSMAFVEGVSLGHKLVDGMPSPRDAARLVKQVAEAVTYAHVEGVIHRDLKPANILIDKNGQPRLTDFGLAKRVEGDSNLTQTGQIVGTPSYMPPEQANGQRSIGPLADVYSLGAVLYCMLSGRPPFQADNPLDTLMQVLQREPVPPRQLNAAVPRDLETICLKCLEKEPGKRYGSAQKLVADLGRFLDGQPIVARPTTTWERTLKWARRRPAVAALLLIGITTAIGLPLLLAGWLHDAELRAKAVEDLDVAARDLQSARGETAKEQKLVQDAQANLHKANENFKTVFRAADKNLQTVIKEVELQKQKAKDTELRATGILLTAHSVAVRPDNPGLALNLAVEGAQRHRDVLANHALWDAMEACREEHTLIHSSAVNAAEFSPDGKWVLTCSGDGSARLWDVASGKELRNLKDGTNPIVIGHFSKDGRRVLTVSHPNAVSEPGMVTSSGLGISGTTTDADWKKVIPVARLWNPADGKLIASWWQPYHDGRYSFASPISAEFSPNSKLVATAFGLYPDGTAEVRDAETGKLVATLTGHQAAVVSAAFSPDSRRVVTASADDTARIYEVEGGKLLHELKGHTSSVMSARFSPDGKKVMTYGHGINHRTSSRGPDTYEDSAARLWDAETGKELPGFRWPGKLKTWVWTASFNHNGSQVVTAGVDFPTDDHFAIWDSATGKRVVSFTGEPTRRLRVKGAVFSPDGRRVASASYEKTASIWDAATGEELLVLTGHEASVRTVNFSADGRRLITTGDDKTARIWEVADRAVSVRRRMLPWQPSMPIFSADGKRAYSFGLAEGKVSDLSVLDTSNGNEVARLPVTSEPLGIGFRTGKLESRWLAFRDPQRDTSVLIFDGTTLTKRFALDVHDKPVSTAVYGPDTKDPRVVTIDAGGKARIWSLTDGKLLRTLTVDQDHPIQQAVFDGSGRLLTTNPPRRDGKVKDDDVRACIWDVESGSKLVTLKTEKTKCELADIAAVAFSADGKQALLSWASNDAPRTWNARTGEELHVLDHAKHQVVAAAFSPDGRQIVTGAGDKQARVWDSLTGKLIRTLDHEATVYQVEFSPDSKLILTSAEWKALRVWDAGSGRLVAQFRDPVGMVRGALSADGREVLVACVRPSGAAGGKCSARIWPIEPLGEALLRKPRELTPAEREQYGVR